jgi:glutathionyl-hydroquinone reductase
MKLIIDGVWRGDIEPDAAIRERVTSWRGAFTSMITDDTDAAFPPVAGRYHLYVSPACPYAHKTLVARALLGLEEVIPVSFVHPVWNTPDGWRFGQESFATPDKVNGHAFLHQLVSGAEPNYTGKVTVPVLFDTTSDKIVSAQSADIVRMMGGPLARFATRPHALRPTAFATEIDALSTRIRADIGDAVYAISDAPNQQRYDALCAQLYATFDELEERLTGSGTAFLFGDQPTEADIHLFTPLVRFDAVYLPLFRIGPKRLADYPALTSFVARFERLEGVVATVDRQAILLHYYDDWRLVNPRIAPSWPAMDWRNVKQDRGHGRGAPA